MTVLEPIVARTTPFKTRYGNFIGGAWVEPVDRRYFDNTSPINGQIITSDRTVERGGRRAGARCRTCRQGWLGTHQPGRSGAGPQSHRRPDGGEPRRPGRGRNMGQRQADPRDHGRGRTARHRPFPLLRRLHPRPGRRAVADRRRHRRLPLPRAPGCRRPDHPVELSAADGLLEAGAGAGGGQLRRAEAGRADPGLDPALDGPGRRPAAAGRPEHRQRLRARVRQAARLVPAHRQDRLHRRDHDRPADHAVRQPEPDPGHAGVGRQVAQRLLRRRRRRGRRLLRQGARRLRHVRAQPGRGLHLPEPRADPREHLRPLHGAGDQAGRGDRARRSARSGHDDRCAGFLRADGEDPVVLRHRPAGRRAKC